MFPGFLRFARRKAAFSFCRKANVSMRVGATNRWFLPNATCSNSRAKRRRIQMGGGYSYFHLVSGVDLPIKNQDYIHSFFEKNAGKEFVGFCDTGATSHDASAVNRLCYRHFFTRYFRSRAPFGTIAVRLNALFVAIQKKLGLRRNFGEIVLKKGCNWVSITNDFCAYLLSKKDWIARFVAHSGIADEVFLHTVLWNSPFRKNIYSLRNEYEGCVRAIDWNRGSPYVWGKSDGDFEILKNSPALFARKFSSEHFRIIEKISEFSGKSE